MFVASNSYLLIKDLLRIECLKRVNNSDLCKIIFEIKQTLKDLLEILERIKRENISWKKNPSIVCILLIKKKSIERCVKSICIYLFYRTKIAETIFWNNSIGFSAKNLGLILSKNDLKFLNVYNQLLLEYFDGINYNLTFNQPTPIKRTYVEIQVNKNFAIIFAKKQKRIFKKNSKLFLKLSEIKRFLRNKFLIKIQ